MQRPSRAGRRQLDRTTLVIPARHPLARQASNDWVPAAPRATPLPSLAPPNGAPRVARLPRAGGARRHNALFFRRGRGVRRRRHTSGRRGVRGAGSSANLVNAARGGDAANTPPPPPPPSPLPPPSNWTRFRSFIN
ncbi:hypothetical protein JYU34_011873 [Plutella xylostella]|uniref:Uncharacterized protein n=1 Tax=Plutella xylostella TaxID=51655 RepID=A0ABQ7QDU0_PLUXY|nr:hypothetical protein JYU34_011873 [Plutella xylostella]